MRDIWKNFVTWVEDAVTLPEDSESIRIRKTTLAIIVIVIIPVNSIWTLSLFYLNLQAAAFFNLAHGFLCTSAIIYLFKTRNFTVFYNYFLAFTFPYIFALQTSLGGIIHSGVLISGGLLAAMAAALILNMVASGVPTARPDHAQAVAHLALDMLDYCEQLGRTQDEKLQLRIGINSGPLTAGVIGNKKFQYDLWGEAVNTASRMESHGEAGKIQVTQATANLLKEEFILKPRGPIDVKGMAKMKTWFLTGRRTES